MPASPLAAPDHVLGLLEQQAARRSRLVPTISVLAGPPPAGLRHWRRWLAGSSRPPVVTPLAAPADVARLLVKALAQHRDLGDDALAAVAGWWGRPAGDVRARLGVQTVADLDLFLEALPVDRTRDPVAVTFLLVRWRHQGSLPAPGQVLDRLGEVLGWPKPAELRLLAAVAALVPAAEWPALLLAAEGADAHADWLPRASRTAAALAGVVPAFPVGLAVPRELLEEHLRAAAESHAVALLREGLILLPPADRQELARRVEEAGGDAAAAAPAIAAVLARGGDPGLAARLAGAARAVAALGDADEESAERARSDAERFLFELLDSQPATAGLFELNGTLDFRFGPRPAEVDLLARSARLAVELDGGFWHLRDPDCYRRDRRKDWELQRRGFLVLRFLAEDVVYRPQEVLDTILAAVASRGRPTEPAGENP
jgi:hypothetical protein